MPRLLVLALVSLFVLALVAIEQPSNVAARPHGPAPSPSPSYSPTPTPQERIATLNQTVRDNPNDKDAQAELGSLLVQTGSPSDGRDHLEAAVQLGNNDAQTWYFIGVADSELGDMQDSVTSFERAELLDPANPAVLQSLVGAYLQAGRIDDALRIANRAVELHPNEAFAYDQLGMVQLNQGKFDAGRASLNKALSIDPKDARAQLLIARSYMAQKPPDADKALALYNTVLATDPKNTEALSGKGEALAQKGDVADAVAALQQVAKLEPDSVEPEDDIAQLYLDKKMIDLARQEFAQAIKDHPKDPEPWVLEAEYDQRAYNPAQAEKEYESAIAVAPQNTTILFEYGRFELLSYKHYAKAQDAFSKITNLEPSNAEALFWLGQSYALQNQWAQARDEFKASFEILHTYTSLFNLGLAYFNLKDYEHAREVFEALASHQDKNHPDPQLWFLLGETYRHMGNKQAATAAYKRYLAYVPTGDASNKARTYIKQMTQ